MGFGGPVWHASVKAATMASSEMLAERALAGRGDATLGEWRERGNRVFHIRRRLSSDEQRLAGDLDVKDMRGTDEGRKRLALLFHEHPSLRAIAQHIGEAPL